VNIGLGIYSNKESAEMILRWLPWKWLIKRAARSYQITDPFMLLARLRKFAEPSEFEAPLELVRAWTEFQARGVVNTRAIQHNLDWVWPYWVERQFNPRDPSFVPRSFLPSHINLTHRNWTAVCLPDAPSYSLIDPRGLVTPLHDGWSIDAWIIGKNTELVSSRCLDSHQVLKFNGELAVETKLVKDSSRLTGFARMRRDEQGQLYLEASWKAESSEPAMLCIALRPYNPEGIQFIDSIDSLEDRAGWLVNRKTQVMFDRKPERSVLSNYAEGDVFHHLDDLESEVEKLECPVGMATAAALFPLEPKREDTISARVSIDEWKGDAARPSLQIRPATTWAELEDRSPILQIPDETMMYLFSAAEHTLLSLSSGEVYPGSYTYRRFWFRDACLMLNALLTLNHLECCRRAFEDSFILRQNVSGFFESQQGEWDSNGQVLWLAERYVSYSGEALSPRVIKSGLLPSGFSAEHLGPNNHYYWDNFWGLAGLRAASLLFRANGEEEYPDAIENEAKIYEGDILSSIESIPQVRSRGAIPAAPGRRMDAGAVGSIAADYPLQLFAPANARIMKTVEFLLGNCMINNGFFHDMIHSGINPYLTLQLAQVLLRAGDERFAPLVRRVAELASETGQWPEAIHPLTNGGCMGDGQHGWAAAEWVLMIRNLFVREEGERLVVGSGLLPEWLNSGEPLSFGPTSTRFGKVIVHVDTSGDAPRVSVDGDWYGEKPEITISLPEYARNQAGG
jgi:hypothetical protein